MLTSKLPKIMKYYIPKRRREYGKPLKREMRISEAGMGHHFPPILDCPMMMMMMMMMIMI